MGCELWFSTKVALKNKVLRKGEQDYFGYGIYQIDIKEHDIILFILLMLEKLKPNKQ